MEVDSLVLVDRKGEGISCILEVVARERHLREYYNIKSVFFGVLLKGYFYSFDRGSFVFVGGPYLAKECLDVPLVIILH